MVRLQRAARWSLAGMAVISAMLVASTILTYLSFSNLQQDREKARNANLVDATAQKLLSAVQDAETGQRGFLLTERPIYLEPYIASIATIEALKQQLRSLAVDNPRMSKELDVLFASVDAKLTELDSTIDEARAHGIEAARQLIVTDSGRRIMDAVREQTAELERQEESEFNRGREIIDSRSRHIKLTALLAALLGPLISIVGGIALVHHINRLKRADQSLQEQASLLQTTLDNAREGVAAFDPAKGLLAWNPRFFELFGYPADFARPGRPFRDLLEFDHKRSERMFDIADDEIAIAGVEQMTKLKTRLSIAGRELECAQKRTATGGVVMTCADITERLHMEQVARQAQKMEAIGQLTGGVAHDFNNLLQIIASNLDLISRHAGDPVMIVDHVKHANTATDRAATLTRQLLAFARRQPLNPAVINLGKRVRAMSDLLHRTLGERIEIETIIDAGMWNAFVDANQLENALLNLAVNARDAMPGGGKLTIELANTVLDENYARRHDEVVPGQYVMLAVTDTGEGMSPNIASQAFEPFFTTKPEGQGTGLGLSMVFGFVKQSGGHVKIYSEVGQGTTIKIYLPRSRRPEEVAPREDGLSPSGGSGRILLVEDDGDVRRAVSEMVQAFGYAVLEAANGDQALALLQGGAKVDLLFTDVVMSGTVTGRALSRRAKEILPGIAVLFTSGYTENSIIHQGRLDEGVHLLSKPYREAELSRTLRAVLEEQRAKNRQAETAGKGEEGGGLSILLVDDDPLIRMSTGEMLRDMGHRVQEAERGSEALAKLAERTPVDVLVVDLALPDMKGTALVAAAASFRRDLRVVFASGYSEQTVDLDPEIAKFVFLPKPYGADQLAEALAKLT